MTPLRIFIGYDPRESIALYVLAHSILRRASGPVSIVPLRRECFPGLRPRDPLDSTEFSRSRFLVPWLCDYDGVAVYMDCDMLCRDDVWSLAYMREIDGGPTLLWPRGRAVSVVKHDYVPKSATKFLGQTQTTYQRKNWSSVMVFNNAECKALTWDYVNEAPGLDLHRFAWLPDDMIGGIPLEWNWLVGEYPYNPLAKLLHWTNGGPWFAEFFDADHADEWRVERRLMGMVG